MLCESFNYCCDCIYLSFRPALRLACRTVLKISREPMENPRAHSNHVRYLSISWLSRHCLFPFNMTHVPFPRCAMKYLNYRFILLLIIIYWNEGHKTGVKKKKTSMFSKLVSNKYLKSWQLIFWINFIWYKFEDTQKSHGAI